MEDETQPDGFHAANLQSMIECADLAALSLISSARSSKISKRTTESTDLAGRTAPMKRIRTPSVTELFSMRSSSCEVRRMSAALLIDAYQGS